MYIFNLIVQVVCWENYLEWKQVINGLVTGHTDLLCNFEKMSKRMATIFVIELADWG